MKMIRTISSVLAALAMIAMPVKAQITYLGNGHVNGTAAADGGAFSSVVINNDASSISFTINSTLPMASWIFYAIEIQHIGQAGSGDTGLINPWGEHIGISTGENALINTYGSGATALTYGGGTWTQNASATYAAGGTGSSFATMTFALGNLGLSVGDSFYFDVISTYASPGGQSAYAAFDNTGWAAETDSSYTPWNGPTTPNYYDSATDAGGTTFGTAAALYTVTPVPEPGTLALLSGGTLLLLAARRKFTR